MSMVFEMARGCQAALASDPENPELLHRLGRLMGQLGQQDLELALVGGPLVHGLKSQDISAVIGENFFFKGAVKFARAFQ